MRKGSTAGLLGSCWTHADLLRTEFVAKVSRRTIPTRQPDPTCKGRMSPPHFFRLAMTTHKNEYSTRCRSSVPRTSRLARPVTNASFQGSRSRTEYRRRRSYIANVIRNDQHCLQLQIEGLVYRLLLIRVEHLILRCCRKRSTIIKNGRTGPTSARFVIHVLGPHCGDSP
jgi:hypothetical protein